LLALSKNLVWTFGNLFESYDNLKAVVDFSDEKRAKLVSNQPHFADYNPFHNFIWV